MDIRRRGFMGLLGALPVVGPGLVAGVGSLETRGLLTASVLTKASSGLELLNEDTGGVVGKAMRVDDGETWLQRQYRELRELKDRIRGKKTRAERMDEEMGRLSRQLLVIDRNVESLVSVSAVAKTHILIRQHNANHQQRMRLSRTQQMEYYIRHIRQDKLDRR